MLCNSQEKRETTNASVDEHGEHSILPRTNLPVLFEDTSELKTVRNDYFEFDSPHSSSSSEKTFEDCV